MNLDKLKLEFSGKTNHQAYELAFTERLLRPDPDENGAYLGNTQRQEFVPHLKDLLEKLPAKPQLFDIGAGSGEIIESALKNLDYATINLVEPNPVLMSKYRQKLGEYENLTEGLSYCGPIQDYYPNLLSIGKSKPREAHLERVQEPPSPLEPQQIVLAIHMLYHLTDFRAEHIDPDADIEKAVSTMFQFLAPGGCIFLVFANQLVSTTGQAGRFYFEETGQADIAERLLKIAESREKLLGRGQIVELLDRRFGKGEASHTSVVTPSCIFGSCEEDIAAMCITAEIGQIDDAPFDTKKLEVCARFVEAHRREIGLAIEDREIPQKGMVRSNQPQIVSVIRKAHG